MMSSVMQRPAAAGIEAGTDADALARKVFILESLVTRLARSQEVDAGASPGDDDADAESAAEAVPEHYDPATLLNRVRKELGLVSDRHLALLCDIPYNRFRKIKERKLPMSPTLLLRLHELSGADVRTLRSWMGDTRELFTRNAIIAEIRPLKTRRRRKADPAQ